MPDPPQALTDDDATTTQLHLRTCLRISRRKLTSAGTLRRRQRFFRLPLAQAYAWTAAILVYELDASALKSASNYFDGCSTRFAYSGLHLTNGYDANSGPICKVLLSPVEQSAGCPALCRGDHR